MIDLNLLKVLDQIDRQGSVTAAAEVLGVGQPAVSQALARLRETLRDELFVRGPGGFVPTPRTRELIGPLRTALGQIDQSLFGPQDFDPASTETRFLLGASDYAAALMTSPLIDRLAAQMPGASLSVLRADKSDAVPLLADGKIDMAIGMFPNVGTFIRSRKLFRDRHVCVFNPALVDLPDPISINDYVSRDQMLVSLDGSATGFVDDALRQRGYRRRIAVTTPYFLQSAYLLESLPLIATLPQRFVARCATLSKMSIRALPFEGPEFTVSAAWRAGDDRNPRMAALVKLVDASARA